MGRAKRNPSLLPGALKRDGFRCALPVLRAIAKPLYAQPVRSRTTDCGNEARNNTAQTHSRTMSLNRNSPARFHAIGSVDRLHVTTPGVVKKNDHVIAKVIMPMNEPSADKTGLKLPATSSFVIMNPAPPRT